MPPGGVPEPSGRHGRRWLICGLLLVITIISYVDRQAMSLVAPSLIAEFHFSNTEIATIVNAFLISYMLGQLLAGRLIDRIGARLAFSLLVGAWSLAAALTSLAGGVRSFSVFRSMLGLAEGVNFPGGVKAIAEWFGPQERATAVGVFTSGASIGAIIAPPLFASIIMHWGWRAAFIVTGLPGLVWILVWLKIYPQRINESDPGARMPPPPTPWSSLLRERLVWGVFLARFLEEPVSWFYLTWLPIYMHGYRHASISTIGIALIFPFVALDLGYLAGGWLSSRLLKSGWSLDAARKSVMVGGALLMIAGIPAANADTTAGFVALVSLAMLGHGGWGSNIFTLPGDFAPPRSVGSVYGVTAVGGSLGAIIFTQVIGQLTDAQQSFRAVFLIAGILPLAAALVLLVVPGRIRPPEAIIDAAAPQA